MLRALQSWLRRRTLREGKLLSRFIARDIRRDILVVSAARVDEGLVTVRVRTTNVLYLAKGLTEEPQFALEVEIPIKDLWHWSGESWGGLPDGTSIADHPRNG